MRRIPTDFRDYVRRFRQRRNVEWEAVLRKWLEAEGRGGEGGEYRIDEVGQRAVRSEGTSCPLDQMEVLPNPGAGVRPAANSGAIGPAVGCLAPRGRW